MKTRKKKRPKRPKQPKAAIPAELFAVETAEEELIRQRRRDQEKTVKEVKKARKARAAICREDVNEFCIFVGRDSETNESITQEEIHEEFQFLADEHKRLIVMSHPESGKTTQLAVLRTLWHLGRNPEKRAVIVSKIDTNATKSTRLIKEYIEKSEELAEVFPELIPGDKWGERFFIVRRPQFSKDPSVQALGLDGSPAGSRIDILILDDVLDLQNTMSPTERKKTLRRIRGAFLDRLSKDAVVIFLTNAWHPEDAAHILEKEAARGKSSWHVAKFPVVDEDGNLSWAAQWDEDRIEEARNDLGALEFARAFLCKARDEGESPFDKDALQAAVDRADEAEIDLIYAVRAEDFEGYAIYHGVDLAVTKKKGSHLTSITTVGLDMFTGERQLLWVEAGRWSSREIRDRVIDHDKRYGGIFIVENNAAQRWIIDIVYNQSDLPEADRSFPTIIPFTTGKQKAHPQFGVEGLAVEFARTEGALWYFPETGPEEAVKQSIELRGEMLYYSRGAHTGDRLMSLWFSREGCRRGALAGRPEKEGKGEHEQAGGSIGSKVRVMILGDEEEDDE